MTRDEFDRECRAQCRHCRNGEAVRYRAETNEYVHEWRGMGYFTITICGANGLRRQHLEFK